MGMMEELKQLAVEDERLAAILEKYETVADLTEEQAKMAVKFLENRHEGAVEDLGGGVLLVTGEDALEFVLADANYTPGEAFDREALRARAEKATAKFLDSNSFIGDTPIVYSYMGIHNVMPNRAYIKYATNVLESA